MKKINVLIMIVVATMLFGCSAPAESDEAANQPTEDQGVEDQATEDQSADLVVNQRVVFDGDINITEGKELVVAAENVLCAQAIGDVTVEETVDGKKTTTTYTIAPYTRLCGATESEAFPGPVAVWVDFNDSTGEIAHVEIAGMGNPVVMEGYGAEFADLQAKKDDFNNMTADNIIADDALTGVLADAVKDAADRFVNKADFTIRPYQSMMVDRYVANNPHFDELKADVEVTTTIAGAYPSDSAYVETEDVEDRWESGLAVTEFGDHAVSHNVVKAEAPGLVLVSYTVGDNEVLSALDIYDNFTLYPEVLSGSDSYGHVVAGPADLTADSLTYRVLGDKAMNFPGGTCGSTVIDITFDRDANIISDIHIAEHSDSTYLANEWEYGGNFADVGEFIYNINAFTNKMIGMSADEPITSYVLSSEDDGIAGGVVEDGGVDMVVTGATRTPNAIISGVNAAIAQYNNDISE